MVLGAGKAAGAMAHALEAAWPADAPLGGLVVPRYGHTPPRPPGVAARIEITEAAHPVPDAAGTQAAARLLALTEGLTADALVAMVMAHIPLPPKPLHHGPAHVPIQAQHQAHAHVAVV